MRTKRTAAIPHGATPVRHRGFTVIELMIVLVVTAILLALATPNLRGVLERNQLLGQANEMAAALTLARSEAVARGLQAGVCASANGTSCSTSAANWGDFVVVYVDEDIDGTFDADEPLLKSFQSTPDVSWTFDTDVDNFLFNAAGFSTLAAQRSVTLCHDEAAEGDRCRTVTVQPSGIVSVTKYTKT